MHTLPAAKMLAMRQNASAQGKFQGLTTPTTPFGLFLFREQEAHVLCIEVNFEDWALCFVSGNHDFLLRARCVSD
jgi:hypothetical protein